MDSANIHSDETVCSSNKKRVLKRRRFPNIRNYFSDYCNSSSIHGVRYIGEKDRNFVERIAWIIVITIACSLCICLILKTYNKWTTSPVIVSFATTETPIFIIPFPAITICPQTKMDPDIFNYTQVLLKKLLKMETTETENSYFESFSLICTGFGQDLLRYVDIERNKTVAPSTMQNIVKALPDIDPLKASTVIWLQDVYNIKLAFSGIFTSEGFCYSFNMLDYSEIFHDFEQGDVYTKARHWSLEEGYLNKYDEDAYPRRTFVSGKNGGFTFEAAVKHNHLDYFCGESEHGFKVVLHHPSELPSLDRGFRVPLDQKVYVGIKPRMITVSDEVKSYRPEVRKCYFSQERPLMYFKIYTQDNCLFECLSNFTLKECGCQEFYMPKFGDSPICGPGSSECLKQSRVKYLVNDTNENNVEESCVCLPLCTSIEYDVEISQTDWKWWETFDILSRIGINFPFFRQHEYHLVSLSVFYKEMQFLTSQRNELYGYVDFFANTGGLLGLFIGFSVTSAVEVLYFLTLRLVCNIKQYGWKYWSGKYGSDNNPQIGESEMVVD